jgi:hypothetical protein
MQNAVEPKDMGVATASVTFFRQVGGTLGTAVFLSILFSSAGSHIKSDYAKAATTPAFQAAAHAHPDQLRQITGGTNLNDTSFLRSMDARLAHPFLTGFAGAMDVVFLTGAAVLVIAFVLSWFMKEVPLRTQSGLEAARSAALASDAGAVDPGGATHEPEQVGTTLTG